MLPPFSILGLLLGQDRQTHPIRNVGKALSAASILLRDCTAKLREHMWRKRYVYNVTATIDVLVTI